MSGYIDNLIGSKIAGGNTAYRRSKSDFYPTPPEATQAILDWLKLPNGSKIWECACGEGHMVEVMRQSGYEVIGTDIRGGYDYLLTETPNNVDFIITNPPFSKAKEFIEKSIERKIPFAFLLKTQFWNSKSRYDLFYSQPPTYILPLTWRPDFLFKTRGKGSPLMDVLWCVWIPEKTETLFRPLLKPTKED